MSYLFSVVRGRPIVRDLKRECRRAHHGRHHSATLPGRSFAASLLYGFAMLHGAPAEPSQTLCVLSQI